MLGQGLCRLPRSAPSLPREPPHSAAGRSCGWKERPLAKQVRILLLSTWCCASQGCSQLQITPRTFAEGPFEEQHRDSIYLKGKESVLRVFSSWLAGWSEGDGNFFLLCGEGIGTPVLVSTCLSCSLAAADTEMPLGSAQLPGGVCRSELSTQWVGWGV